MQNEKRKRASNFTEEEKLRFLRVLQEKGHIIVSKVTSHDTRTNHMKEEAWIQICNDMNSNGSTMRTTDTLKKQWQKMKSDAKTFKSIALHQVRGTGGGPSKKMDDPVLELVAEITGRGTSGIQSVADSDSNLTDTLNEITDPLFSPAVPQVTREVFDNTMINLTDQEPESIQNNCVTPTFSLKRRRPHLSNTNERSIPTQARVLMNNNFASKRLESEKEKIDLIKTKKEQEIEMHNLRMQNEQKLFLLKEAIVKQILAKLQDELNPDVVKMAFQIINNKD